MLSTGQRQLVRRAIKQLVTINLLGSGYNMWYFKQNLHCIYRLKFGLPRYNQDLSLRFDVNILQVILQVMALCRMFEALSETLISLTIFKSLSICTDVKWISGLCATPWMFPPLGILLEYWIEHVTFGLFYVMFTFPTRIFYSRGSGFVTDCPCSVWHRGLTTWLPYVGPRFEI